MNRDYEGEQALLEVSRLQRKALEYDLAALDAYLEKLEKESKYKD